MTVRAVLPALAASVLFAGPLAAPALAQNEPVYPVYDGFTITEDGLYVVSFAYFSHNFEPVTVPPGPRNRFEPAAADRGQPATFLPGHQRFQCVMVLDPDFAGDLRWTVDHAGVSTATSEDMLQYNWEFEERSMRNLLRDVESAEAPRGPPRRLPQPVADGQVPRAAERPRGGAARGGGGRRAAAEAVRQRPRRGAAPRWGAGHPLAHAERPRRGYLQRTWRAAHGWPRSTPRGATSSSCGPATASSRGPTGSRSPSGPPREDARPRELAVALEFRWRETSMPQTPGGAGAVERCGLPAASVGAAIGGPTRRFSGLPRAAAPIDCLSPFGPAGYNS